MDKHTPTDGIASSVCKVHDRRRNGCHNAKKADAKTGDVILIIADTNTSKVLTQLGTLRIEVSQRLGIEKKGYNLLWITEFPFFEYDEESGEWLAMHHPFTAPLDECLEYLETDKAKVRAKAYDLVLNGIELSSGSIRITNPELQNRIFTLLGLTNERDCRKVRFPHHGVQVRRASSRRHGHRS